MGSKPSAVKPVKYAALRRERLVGSESGQCVLSGATCLPADCCFGELALVRIQLSVLV